MPVPFFCWAGVGERELAEDTGLARSAYMSSESALRTELLLDEALDTEETLLTLRDLPTSNSSSLPARPAGLCHFPAWMDGGKLDAQRHTKFVRPGVVLL